MSASSPDGSNKNWAIAIVHGIGTPGPGETREAVCAGIRRVNSDFVLIQNPDQPATDKEGAPLIQHWSFNGKRARVAEVFWGDLSLVRGTIPDMIRAICTNLYGAVYVNSRILQTTSKFTRFLPIVPFYLVRWIVLPLHVLAVCLAVPAALRYWGERPAGANGYLTTNDQFFLWTAVCCVLAGLTLTIWLIRLQRESVRPQPWDMSFLFAIFAAFSALFADKAVANWFTGNSTLGAWFRDHSVTAWFENCIRVYGPLEKPRGFGQMVGEGFKNGFDVSRDVCQLIVANTPIEKPEVSGVGKYIAVNEFVGDVAFYASAGMLLLYIFIALAYAVFGKRDVARPMFFVATISLLFIVATAILLEVFDFITRTVQYGGVSNFKAYWYEVGFVAWLAIVAVGAGVSIAWRSRLSRSHNEPSLQGDQKTKTEVAYARLIVSAIFQFAVILATALFILVFLANEMIGSGIRAFDAQYKLLAPAFAALLLGIVIYFKQLRLGLDMAMDVVNHFVAPGKGFPIRRSISERFHNALDVLIDEAKSSNDTHKPHLLIIAHSQGAVIVVDALVKDLWNTPIKSDVPALKERVSSMTILTFGSPLTHIYQHYFPGDYGALAATPLQRLAADGRVKWLNVFRIDDPVGTVIAGPDERFPKNVHVSGGGHLRYWEEDVLGEQNVRQHLPGN